MQGQLYIKVVEARNCIVAHSGGFSDPYIEFHLGEHGSEKFKTKVFKKTLNPKWNEEFIISVHNRGSPLQMRMMSHNLLRKDTPMGTLSVDLTRLPDNILIDSWYKLLGVSAGELRLLLRFTPMTLPNQKKELVNTRLAMFRLVLERRVYFPGEAVRGTVQFNVGMPKKIRGVRVHFHGEQHTEWTEEESYVDFNGQMSSRTRIYSETVNFFNVYTTLWGNKRHGDSLVIDSGTYLWPFQFILPPNLPPTYQSSYGYTRYYCRAYVDIPWGRDKEVKTYLIIHVHYASIKIVPELYLGKKHYRGDQQINLLANLASNITYAGRPQNLHVVLTNQSNKEVTHMTITLKRHTTYFAEGRHRYFRANVFKITVKDGFPCFGGQRYERDIAFNVPRDVLPSMPREISPLIRLYYTLSIDCNCKGLFSGSVKTKIPVVISNLPFELQQITPPTVPMGTPMQLVVYNTTTYYPPPPIMSASVLQHEQGVFVQPQLFQSYGGEGTFTPIKGDPEEFTPRPVQSIPQQQISYLPQQLQPTAPPPTDVVPTSGPGTPPPYSVPSNVSPVSPAQYPYQPPPPYQNQTLPSNVPSQANSSQYPSYPPPPYPGTSQSPSPQNPQQFPTPPSQTQQQQSAYPSLSSQYPSPSPAPSQSAYPPPYSANQNAITQQMSNLSISKSAQQQK
jgi:hypothetical protein